MSFAFYVACAIAEISGCFAFYIAASLVWLWLVEGARPDRWDAVGAAICLFGAALIVYGPRSAA